MHLSRPLNFINISILREHADILHITTEGEVGVARQMPMGVSEESREYNTYTLRILFSSISIISTW